MSDVPSDLLVIDVPCWVDVDRLRCALIGRGLHHVDDLIGPYRRLWVYCPGGAGHARPAVRAAVEDCLTQDAEPARSPRPVFHGEGGPTC